MSSPQILDLATLLAPIPGDHPAGESLFYNDTYDVIKEARRADDALEQGEWQRDIKTADWSAVIALTTAALATHSKEKTFRLLAGSSKPWSSGITLPACVMGSGCSRDCTLTSGRGCIRSWKMATSKRAWWSWSA